MQSCGDQTAYTVEISLYHAISEYIKPTLSTAVWCFNIATYFCLTKPSELHTESPPEIEPVTMHTSGISQETKWGSFMSNTG